MSNKLQGQGHKEKIVWYDVEKGLVTRNLL